MFHAGKEKVMNILKQSKIKVNPQIAPLQFAHADTQTKICKRAVFLQALGAKIVHLRNFKNIFEC